MNNNKFIKNFKSWLNQQKENAKHNEDLIGEDVYPKISFKKLCETIDVVKGNAITVSKNFASDGGIVENIIDNQALISTKKGRFYIDIRDIKKS